MLIVVVILVALATYFLLQGITAGQRQVAVSLRRAKTYGGYSLHDAELGKSMSDRVVGPAAHAARVGGPARDAEGLPRGDPPQADRGRQDERQPDHLPGRQGHRVGPVPDLRASCCW